MKKLFPLWAACVCVALTVSSCDRGTDPAAADSKAKGTLTIGVEYQPASRAQLSGTLLSPTVDAFENLISHFDAYVFDWSSGFLEASARSDNGGQVTISGVSTTTKKRIVVIANGDEPDGVPSIGDGRPMTNYSQLAEAFIDFESQAFLPEAIAAGTTPGLLMTGENNAGMTVKEDEANAITIAVRRIVSKVELGTISFDTNMTIEDLLRFSISSGSIQQAIGASTISPAENTHITPYFTDSAPLKYYGGYITNTAGNAAAHSTDQNAALLTDMTIANEVASIVTDLNPTLTIGGSELALATFLSNISGYIDNPTLTGLEVTLAQALTAAGKNSSLLTIPMNAFWYVLPNDGSTGIFSTLTLKGNFAGTDYFYPIEINTPDSNANSPSLGAATYMKQNTRYTINVKFHNLIGTLDPDTPGKDVAITVTVTPAPWEGPIIQNTTW